MIKKKNVEINKFFIFVVYFFNNNNNNNNNNNVNVIFINNNNVYFIFIIYHIIYLYHTKSLSSSMLFCIFPLVYYVCIGMLIKIIIVIHI